MKETESGNLENKLKKKTIYRPRLKFNLFLLLKVQIKN